MIKEEATAHEKTSPVFQKNKEICLTFEREAKEMGGVVKGSYGAWSFLASATFGGKLRCRYTIEKSSYTKGGIIFLKNVYYLSRWHFELPEINRKKVVIKKGNIFDFLGISGFKVLDELKGYTIKPYHPSNDLINQIIHTITPILENKSIYFFKIENGKLQIKIDSDTYYFNIFKELKDKIYG